MKVRRNFLKPKAKIRKRPLAFQVQVTPRLASPKGRVVDGAVIRAFDCSSGDSSISL
jgi:hypothetical protein